MRSIWAFPDEIGVRSGRGGGGRRAESCPPSVDTLSGSNGTSLSDNAIHLRQFGVEFESMKIRSSRYRRRQCRLALDEPEQRVVPTVIPVFFGLQPDLL